MTNITFRSGGEVIRTLAPGYGAIMTRRTDTIDFVVIDIAICHRRKRRGSSRMTLFTIVRGVDMGTRLG